MSRATFEVVPVEDTWVIRMPGDSIWETRPTKAEAIQRARELGRRYATWRVRVLSRVGELETELDSPEPPPAS
jgi:3-methyladenine DNA glycosylase/8-oxoguanine DNA glycosylase